MITLNCPDCGQTYEVDDNMAGKKAACQCGAILFVPKTVAPPGQKTCPGCNSVSGEESVICVECGHNFQTGGKIRSAESRVEKEEDNEKIILLRRMIKPCIMLVIAVIVGVIAYRMFFVKYYGISSGAPIGTLAKIEEHLNKYGYVKQDEKKPYIPEYFGDGAAIMKWKDVKLEKRSKGMYSEVIFVVLGPDKKVLGIGANFKGTVGSIPGDTGSGTGRFMSSFWKEAGLPFPPEYKSVKVGKGAWASTYKIAKANAGELRGEWVDYPSSVTVLPSSNTMLITYSRFGDASYKNVQSKPYEAYDFKSIKDNLKKKSENPETTMTDKEK